MNTLKMLKTLEKILYWKPTPTLLAIGMLIGMIISAGNHNDFRRVAILSGMIGGIVFQCIIGWTWRRIVMSALAVALSIQPLSAQEAPEPAPGYDWQFVTALRLSMPEQPGQEHMGLLGVGICAAGIVAVGGYIIVKVISACVNEYEYIVTNNAACGECPAKSPPPTSPVPTPSGDPPTTGDCQCSAPPAADQPLPLRLEHSFDEHTWTEVATGIGIGSQVVLPDTGYWRMVPLFVSISSVEGVLTVHAPPGVLEYSADLRAWSVVGTHTSPTDLPAQAGFYRVRLN
jgi:hypothetical protein